MVAKEYLRLFTFHCVLLFFFSFHKYLYITIRTYPRTVRVHNSGAYFNNTITLNIKEQNYCLFLEQISLRTLRNIPNDRGYYSHLLRNINNRCAGTTQNAREIHPRQHGPISFFAVKTEKLKSSKRFLCNPYTGQLNNTTERGIERKIINYIIPI